MNTSDNKYDLNFAYANGAPEQCLNFRACNEDFIVDEVMNVELSGEGEHLWLKVKKNGENTQWVAEKLAKFFSVNTNDVGYAGMKDRHAITSQWFSIYLPGKSHALNWDDFIAQSEVNAQLLESGTHSQKLRRGMHSGNHFVIRLSNLDGCVLDQDELSERLLSIQSEGVPNYFGEQRFGREANNITMAVEWFTSGRPIRNRHKKGLAMSAARSYLYNMVLSQRVTQENWSTRLAGDVDSFKSPTGPLWGRGRALSSENTLLEEETALKDYSLWCDQLEHCGLNQERRSLVLMPNKLSWTFDNTDINRTFLQLSFQLPSGEFATSVLRELVTLKNARHDA